MSHPSENKSNMPPKPRLPLTVVVASSSNLGIGFKGQLPWHIKADLQYFARVTSRVPSSSSSSSSSTSSSQPQAQSPEQQHLRRNAVIMGRKTWESIPPKFRPLKNRVNVVVSRNTPIEAMASSTTSGAGWETGPIWVNSLEQAVGTCQRTCQLASEPAREETSTTMPEIERAFVIGGAQIYDAAAKLDRDVAEVDSVLLTRVFGEFEVDTYLSVDYDKDAKQWKKASLQELRDFVGEEVPDGRQKEGDVEFEFRLYKRTT